MTYTSHNKICYACGQEKRRRQLGYDIRTLKTYCKEDCPHPELIPNVKLVELRTDDLKDALESHYDTELMQAFNRVLGKTVSTRPVPAMAMHLMKTAQANELETISETLTFILERDFANYEIPGPLVPEEETAAEEVQAEIVDNKPWARLEPIKDPITEGKPYNMLESRIPTPEEIQIKVNEKPIEPKQEEEDDDEWEI